MLKISSAESVSALNKDTLFSDIFSSPYGYFFLFPPLARIITKRMKMLSVSM